MALSARQRPPVWPPLSASSGPRLFQLFTQLQHHLPTQPAENERVIFCCLLPASLPGQSFSSPAPRCFSRLLLYSSHPLRSGSPCVLWQWPSLSSLQLSDSIGPAPEPSLLPMLSVLAQIQTLPNLQTSSTSYVLLLLFPQPRMPFPTAPLGPLAFPTAATSPPCPTGHACCIQTC